MSPSEIPASQQAPSPPLVPAGWYLRRGLYYNFNFYDFKSIDEMLGDFLFASTRLCNNSDITHSNKISSSLLYPWRFPSIDPLILTKSKTFFPLFTLVFNYLWNA